MAAASMLGLNDSTGDDKLAFEIFSILENKFLFGPNPSSPSTPGGGNGKVRILSIDAGGSTHGLLAAKSLAHLEATLIRHTGNLHARLADFFDVVAGAGAGGVLAGMLFTRARDGRPLFSAEEALEFMLNNSRKLSGTCSTGGLVRRVFRSSNGSADGLLEKLFGDLTLKDTLKAVLIPCYDLGTGAPFLFSRADALEMDGCDFRMADVCRATIANSKALEMRSNDGRKKISAVGGGVAMSNPTAAAITHVLNNKLEFPLCRGVEDVVVVSLGNGEMDCAAASGNYKSSPAAYLSIAGDGASDMVDQAVSMAFGESRCSNYVRIQGNNGISSTSVNNNNKNKKKKKNLESVADQMLGQKNVESVLFKGKKLGERSNVEKLNEIGKELIKEQQWRNSSGCVLPPVILKHSSTTSLDSPPRSSSATTLSTVSSA
ncbi:OLC1v1038259C1 [Oldenlandia corymbosa var. corymbosa]|uniref:Patatin n=1 Tax=Oldenlandia corymbosa var. corymbosa TaxID=529605 RepID=A0AAV1D222_OLDCO|nr:OLC1v1038259C1 [Oldenlandia corymbosa var. corymbosa]